MAVFFAFRFEAAMLSFKKQACQRKRDILRNRRFKFESLSCFGRTGCDIKCERRGADVTFFPPGRAFRLRNSAPDRATAMGHSK